LGWDHLRRDQPPSRDFESTRTADNDETPPGGGTRQRGIVERERVPTQWSLFRTAARAKPPALLSS